MRSEHWVRENAELLWLCRDAESDMGSRALQISEASERGVAFGLAFGIQPSPPPPSREAQRAARRQAIYRRAWDLLTPGERAILVCAYSAARRIPPEMLTRHGAAAAVVLRASRASKDAAGVAECVEAMRSAQERYEAIRAAQKAADRLEREAAKRAGDARRQAHLERVLGRKPTARVRASAEIEEAAEVMRRAKEAWG